MIKQISNYSHLDDNPLENFYELCYQMRYNGSIVYLLENFTFSEEELRNGLLYLGLSCYKRCFITKRAIEKHIKRKIYSLHNTDD